MSDYIIRNPESIRDKANIISILSICFPRLKKTYLRRRIFGDPAYDKSSTYILERNNTIISHVQLFKKSMYWGGKRAGFLGLGFICTLPEYRNKGYAGKLIKHIVKKKGKYLLGLFTKLTGYYKEFGFEIVPRKRIIIKRADFKFRSAFKVRIRRFNFDRDISQVMNIHKNYFSGQTGALSRGLSDWKNQFSYFDEEKRFFLVAECCGRIQAYLRCKLKESVSDSSIEVVEYAFIGENERLISDFISYLFRKLKIKLVGGNRCFLKYALDDVLDFKEEADFAMMLRFNGVRKKSNLSGYGMCFLESDGF